MKLVGELKFFQSEDQNEIFVELTSEEGCCSSMKARQLQLELWEYISEVKGFREDDNLYQLH